MYGLNEWVRKWLDVYKRVMVKPSTYDSYVTYCSNIDCDTPIDELTAEDVQGIVNRLAVEGKAYSTIKHAMTLIRQSLRKALQLGYVNGVGFLDNVEMPVARSKRVEGFTDDDVGRFLATAGSYKYGDFYLALFYTGCRVGELIGLRWSDVDFMNNIINVRNTDYRGELQPVKTISGVRRIPMYDELHEIVYRRFLRLVKGERVFVDERNRPLRYRSLLDDWRAYCDGVGLPRCGFHVLRHSFARWSIRQGVPVKVVSALLGHSSASVTLNIYDYVDISDVVSAGEVLSESIKKRRAL